MELLIVFVHETHSGDIGEEKLLEFIRIWGVYRKEFLKMTQTD